jgi:hypothetical protein
MTHIVVGSYLVSNVRRRPQAVVESNLVSNVDRRLRIGYGTK